MLLRLANPRSVCAVPVESSSALNIVPCVSMAIGPLGHSNTLALGSEDGQMREQAELGLLGHPPPPLKRKLQACGSTWVCLQHH